MTAPRAQPQSAGAAEHGQQNSKAKLARGERERERARGRERERERGGGAEGQREGEGGGAAGVTARKAETRPRPQKPCPGDEPAMAPQKRPPDRLGILFLLRACDALAEAGLRSDPSISWPSLATATPEAISSEVPGNCSAGAPVAGNGYLGSYLQRSPRQLLRRRHRRWQRLHQKLFPEKRQAIAPPAPRGAPSSLRVR